MTLAKSGDPLGTEEASNEVFAPFVEFGQASALSVTSDLFKRSAQAHLKQLKAGFAPFGHSGVFAEKS